MDLKVFYEVVVPLLEMEQAVLIMISTPVNSFNFYSQLIRLKNPETGKSLFLVYEVDLVCERCKLTSQPQKCRHMVKYLPSWKSTEMLDVVAMIFKDRITTLLRESMGVISDEGGGIFDPADVDYIAKAPPWDPEESQKPMQVLIVCDPNARDTKASSEMALVAIVMNGGNYVIAGLDSHKAANAPQAIRLLREFITGIKAHPALSQARIMFCAESNMAHEAGFLAHEIRQFDDVEIVTDGRKADGKVSEGWFTTHDVKVTQAYDAWDIISQNGLTFLKDWVCANPFERNVDKRRKETLEKLLEQLKRYAEVELPTKDPLSIPRTGVSGVLGKDGQTSSVFNDDQCTALCMALYLWKKLRRREIADFPYSRVFGADPHRGIKRNPIARTVVTRARKRVRFGGGR